VLRAATGNTLARLNSCCLVLALLREPPSFILSPLGLVARVQQLGSAGTERVLVRAPLLGKRRVLREEWREHSAYACDTAAGPLSPARPASASARAVCTPSCLNLLIITFKQPAKIIKNGAKSITISKG